MEEITQEQTQELITNILQFIGHSEVNSTLDLGGSLMYHFGEKDQKTLFIIDPTGIMVFEPGTQGHPSMPGWYYLRCDLSLDHLSYVVSRLENFLFRTINHIATSEDRNDPTVQFRFSAYQMLHKYTLGVMNMFARLSPSFIIKGLEALWAHKLRLLGSMEDDTKY
jgi:hypothetical protein